MFLWESLYFDWFPCEHRCRIDIDRQSFKQWMPFSLPPLPSIFIQLHSKSKKEKSNGTLNGIKYREASSIRALNTTRYFCCCSLTLSIYPGIRYCPSLPSQPDLLFLWLFEELLLRLNCKHILDATADAASAPASCSHIQFTRLVRAWVWVQAAAAAFQLSS